MLKRGSVCTVTHPHFRTVRDMHVRTDHVNWHAGVSGPYGDSTGGISNGAAQFSVLSPNTLVMGVGLYVGSTLGYHSVSVTVSIAKYRL